MSSDANHAPAIETVGLSKRFGETIAVGGLDLRIPRGSTFGFIGPNGAGKSTTIKMLMGLLRPTGGSTRVLGRDPIVDGITVKQRAGYVPERPSLYGWMRVCEAIRFCRTLYERWNDTLCDELLNRFDLDPNRRVKQLSKGMVVKLSLLLAVSHEPDVLILDEPMAGLDPIAREEVLDGVLRTAGTSDRTILFSSHTLSDVQRLADTIGIIHEGKLLVHAGVDELLTGTKRIRAVLRNGAAPQRPPQGTIWQQTAQREWLVTVTNFTDATVEAMRASNDVDRVEVFDLALEDIFKDYVRGRKAGSCT